MAKLTDNFSRVVSPKQTKAAKRITPRTDRAAVTAALHTANTTSLFKLASAPRELADKQVEIKLVYNAAYGRPDMMDVQAFISNEFPGTEMADVVAHNPGLMTLILRAQMDAGNLPAGTAEHTLPGGSKRGPAVDEEIEGTGKIGSSKQAQAAPPAPPDPVEVAQDQGAAPPAQNVPTPTGDQPGAGDSGMSLEQALDQLTEAAEAVKQKVEQGDAILHGQEVTPVDEAPQASTPPVATPPAAAAPVQASTKEAQIPPAWLIEEEKKRQRQLQEKERQRPQPEIPIHPDNRPPDKLAQRDEADWIRQKRLEEVRERLKEQKQTPAPAEDGDTASGPARYEPSDLKERVYQQADDLFFKEWQGAASSGDAGMRYGYERIPASIYAKLVQRGGGGSQRGYYKTVQGPNGPVKEWMTSTAPKWDLLSMSEFQTALKAMNDSYEKFRSRALAFGRAKDFDSSKGRKPSDKNPLPKIPRTSETVEACDDSAKEYYHDYYGEYGDQMTKEVSNTVDRIADILVAADEAKTELSDNQVLAMLRVLESRPEVHGAFERYAQMGGEPSMDQMVAMALELSQSDRSVAKILDKMTVQYLIKTSDALNRMTPAEQQVILERAVRSSPHLYKKLLRLYNKHLGIGDAEAPITPAQPQVMQAAMKLTAAGMKEPKVKGQPDDVVDVIKLEDVAVDENIAPPGHIPMTYSDPVVKGVYTYITVAWDPEDVHVSGQSLLTAIRRYVVNMASHKEPIDWGLIGPVHIDDVDPQAGVATVHFRTVKPGNAPIQVQSKE